MAEIAQTFSIDPYAAERAKIARQQKFAELLQSQALQPNEKFSYAGIEAPISAASGLAKALQAGMSGYLQGDAARKEDAANIKQETDYNAANEAFTRGMSAKQWVNPDTGGPTIRGPRDDDGGPGAMMPTAPAGGLEGATEALAGMQGNPYAGRLSQQLMMRKLEQDTAAQLADAKRTQGLADAKELYKFQQTNKGPAELPAEVKEFEYAQSKGFPGSFMDFQTLKRKAGATTVMVGGDNPSDAALRKKLSEKEGERWSSLKEIGSVSAGLGQDFQALDQLMTVAPQGVLTGRLAEAFPGFSSAGDVFQSIVTRIAPTLRTPGSGSTSDIEYEGMLNSLPRLRFQPEANRAIGEMMKAKAALNVERSQIVTAYENQEIDAPTARRKLEATNKKSIISPELKAALDGIGAGLGGQFVPQPDGSLTWVPNAKS